ncbi:MAG: hypothetical protein ABIV26_00465, partial [Candidatus Limnocylindrales bacterium]
MPPALRILVVLAEAPAPTVPGGADDCCAACGTARAAAQGGPAPLRGPLPVVGLGAQPGAGISRSTDRRIAYAGLMVSAVYLGLAVASLLLPPAMRLGTWLPAHLALAGAAATAIAAVLPFFTAALVVAQPVRPAIRL